jgi:pimeloyl-ACP methyl ester carboxylesterase
MVFLHSTYGACLREGPSTKTFNRFNHYTSVIEGLTIHFIHENSKAQDAIPLVLVHGWPGSFLEFAPIINELTKEATTVTGKKVSFDVVVVSLPGFAFSSVPPVDWTAADTARIFNTLMTKVLHYDTYATFGTDWGAGIAYSMYDQFNSTVRAVSLDFLPFHPYTSDQLAAENITLSPLEEFEQAAAIEWNNSGEGYFIEQTTKVRTM